MDDADNEEWKQGDVTNLVNTDTHVATNTLVTSSYSHDEAALVQTPPRSKTSSRVHFVILTVGMLVLLLLCFISLGSFGKKQSDFANFYSSERKCILYATYEGQKDGVVLLNFSNYGPCGFLFWGFVSMIIVAFSFIVYLVVLTVLGSRIFSPLRILDFMVSSLTFVGSFILSITITAGLKQTCAAGRQHTSCSAIYLVHTNNIEDGGKLFFYDSIVVAQNSSWVTTLLVFTFSVWNCILMVLYCIQRKKRKERAVVI